MKNKNKFKGKVSFKMNQSTDIEILTYLRENAGLFNYVLKVEQLFTKKIKKHEKHLSNIALALLDNNNYNKNPTTWETITGDFLEHLYLPSLEWYNELEKLYEVKSGQKIMRCIGEKSDFVEEKQDECHVCCVEFTEKDTHLSCGHWICKSCIINSGKEYCPLCRKQVNLTPKEYSSLLEIRERRRKEKVDEEHRQLIQTFNFPYFRPLQHEHEVINIEAFVRPAFTMDQRASLFLDYQRASGR